MRKGFLLKESYISYVFWLFFTIALIFYFALYKINSRLNDINYLLTQKNQLESATTQNNLEIITLQNFIKKNSAAFSTDMSSQAFTKRLEKLLQQYSFADDCLTIQQNEKETIYTIEDTADYFLLQSFLFDICKLYANVTGISIKAENEHIHFVITILE